MKSFASALNSAPPASSSPSSSPNPANPRAMRSYTSLVSPPSNGVRPTRHSYAKIPTAQQSTSGPYPLWFAALSASRRGLSHATISGAMYTVVPSLVTHRFFQKSVANPKSVSLHPSSASPRSKFSGLTSRCTTPRAWRYPRASATGATICRAVSSSVSVSRAERRLKTSPRAANSWTR